MTDTQVTPAPDYPWFTLDESQPSQRILLFYGPSGVGKTFLAGQLPRPLFLACDPGLLGGTESVKQFGPKLLKIKSYDHFMNTMPVLQKAAGNEFDTLIVDSTSYLASLTLRAILEMVGREIPRFEEWNLNATRMRKAIKMITDLPCHIVFTAVDKIDKDETTGKMFGGPDLPGKLAKELPQACDSVLRLYTTTGYAQDGTGKLVVKYRFRSVPDDIWFAKDRTGKLPAEGDCSYDILKPLFEEKGTST